MEKNWEEIVREKYREYKKIGYIECPAFGGERVYFTKSGFDHLIRKGRKLRIREQQMRRLDLLEKAPSILNKCDKFSFYLQRSNRESTAYFWSFETTEGGMTITVIVRQLGENSKHFFSIFDNQNIP